MTGFAIFFLVFGCVFAQETRPLPRFEVSSIKPAVDTGGAASYPSTGRWRAENRTAVDLITYAYDILVEQVVGAPKWASSEGFDIVGTFSDGRGSGQARSDLQARVQTLLADRFQLRAHHVASKMAAYALSRESGRKERVRVETDRELSYSIGSAFMQFEGISMDEFARHLSRALRTPVSNRTGLPGFFKFRIDFDPGGPEPNSAGALSTAIREHLGLRLSHRRVPIDHLVIEQLRHPTPN